MKSWENMGDEFYQRQPLLSEGGDETHTLDQFSPRARYGISPWGIQFYKLPSEPVDVSLINSVN